MQIKKHCVYTLKEECPVCGKRTRSAHPARFTVADKYAKYRRIAKQLNSNKTE